MPTPNEPEKDGQYFAERFNALQAEASQHGVTTIVILHETDPLSCQSGLRILDQFAEPYLAKGMLSDACRLKLH